MKYFTYVDWTLEPESRAIYVGKGLEYRVKRRYRNSLHRHLIDRFGLRREIALETDDEQAAFRLEISLIKELRTHFTLGGANFTWGGEGASGRIVTETTRKLISQALTGHSVSESSRQKMSVAVQAWLTKPDTRERLSQIHRQRLVDPLERCKQAKFKGRKHTDAAKAKIAAAHKGSKRSLETRRKQSEAAKRNMALLKTRQRRSEALTGIKRSEETRQKLRDAWKRRKAKAACDELSCITEEMNLYEWQRSGSV